ncbi:MAG: Nif3-like dinuclear metal center hexameric protein [Phycisphaerae bacterium]|nr:Nif3-like dinuclear metal center hexameric protein [Phycisphaerae bacterium]
MARKKASKAASGLPTVSDLHTALNGIAPLRLAAEWDNVGLLAGRMEWPAGRVLLAIDLTDAVAREALAANVDTLVVYHPPIFRGIRAVTAEAEAPTTLLPDLLAARISIYALHTALDAAAGGTNDVLLDVFEPAERWPLESQGTDAQAYKLVVFVPAAEVAGLRSALSAAGAGVIGHYSECSYELDGRGTFKSDAEANPSIGRRQVLETVAETRLEMIVPRPRLAAAVRALYATHGYEEPAFDLYPLHEIADRGIVGLGRVGRLRRPARGTALLRRLGESVDLSAATVVGDLERPFTSVTTAAGAFGVRGFRDPDSLVVTGEFKHHDALDLLKRGITAVHVDHYASERPVLPVLRKQLGERLRGVEVGIARADRSPFRPLVVK